MRDGSQRTVSRERVEEQRVVLGAPKPMGGRCTQVHERIDLGGGGGENVEREKNVEDLEWGLFGAVLIP